MKFVPEAVGNKLARPLLHLRGASPQIMFAAGAVGVVGATVLACRATLKVSDTLAETEKLKLISDELHMEHQLGIETGDTVSPEAEEYTDSKYAKDQMVLKAKTVFDLMKLYAPAGGLLILSIALLTGSHVTLTKRNAGLTAAYASVDQTFRKYRERVVEKLGRDSDDEFRYGTREVQETVEGKDGKTKTVTHKRAQDGVQSGYAKFFDESSSAWQRDPEYNRIFLEAQQRYFNEMLRARGHVFLNEVYDALDIPRTGQGAIVGWVLTKDGPNIVDFGIFDNIANPHVRDFVNGNEASILLDFNVDGVIYDKI